MPAVHPLHIFTPTPTPIHLHNTISNRSFCGTILIIIITTIPPIITAFINDTGTQTRIK